MLLCSSWVLRFAWKMCLPCAVCVCSLFESIRPAKRRDKTCWGFGFVLVIITGSLLFGGGSRSGGSFGFLGAAVPQIDSPTVPGRPMGPSTPLCDPLWFLYLNLVRRLLCLFCGSFVGSIQGTDILAITGPSSSGSLRDQMVFSASLSLSLCPRLLRVRRGSGSLCFVSVCSFSPGK